VFSIIIPTYNRKKLLSETIDSVLHQSCTNWQLIIVDDNSTDGSYEFFKRLYQNDLRIDIIQQKKKTRGAPSCRNLGVKMAKHELIIFLDSDDLMAPWCIERRHDAITNSKPKDIYLFDALEFTNKKTETYRLRSLQGHQNPLRAFLNLESVWQTSCAVWKKSALEKIGGWDNECQIWQDGEIHIRALLSGLDWIWMETLPDVFIRKHDESLRISNMQNSSVRLISLTKTYMKIGSEMKNSEDKELFIKNYSELIANHCEVMRRDQLAIYLKWFKENNPPVRNKKLIHSYLKLVSKFRVDGIGLKLLYQFRKISIPFKRHNFFSTNDQISPKKLNQLVELNLKSDHPITGVSILK